MCVYALFGFSFYLIKIGIYHLFAQMCYRDLSTQTAGYIFHMGFWNNAKVIFLAMEKYRILE